MQQLISRRAATLALLTMAGSAWAQTPATTQPLAQLRTAY
jgi:iron complex transport system substrate-binding protein